VNLEELAASMGPARGFQNITCGIQGIESSKGIGLQNPLEGFQVGLRMFALAVGRVGKPDGGWCFVSSRPIIADIGPQSPRLGLAIAWGEDWDRCVVGMQLLAGQHVLPQPFNQRA
jgi:hypothetical protein